MREAPAPDRDHKWSRASSIAATCSVVIIVLLAGFRGTDGRDVGRSAQPPQKSIKRIPDLVGMSYEQARTSFLRAGGAIVKSKPRVSDERRGTVLGQQPPPGERFTHSVELVIATPKEAGRGRPGDARRGGL